MTSHTQHPSHFERDSPLSSRLHPPGLKLSSEHTKDEAGVCEAYPGIIESTDIDPLHHERMKEEKSSSIASKASGAAKYAYSAAVGDQAGKQAGKESMLGSSK